MASGGAFKTGGKVVQLSTDAGSHSYSEEELAGIVSHINRCLASDSLLQSGTLPHGKIPIATPVDIFQALRDGVILCKFVNTFGGDKPLIPSFTSKAQMMEIHMRENISKALEAATTIKGINIINIHTAEICQGKAPHVTLGLLWQLVAYDLKLKVTRLAMANTNETATPVTVSDAERVILEWANFHLAHANVPPISNFGSDLNDSMKLVSLMHQLDARCEAPDSAFLAETDLGVRAHHALKQADTIGCCNFINAEDIVKGNSRLLFAFLANMFQKYPDLETPEAKQARLDRERQKREEEAKSAQDREESLRLREQRLLDLERREEEFRKRAEDFEREMAERLEKEKREREDRNATEIKEREERLRQEEEERQKREREEREKKEREEQERKEREEKERLEKMEREREREERLLEQTTAVKREEENLQKAKEERAKKTEEEEVKKRADAAQKSMLVWKKQQRDNDLQHLRDQLSEIKEQQNILNSSYATNSEQLQAQSAEMQTLGPVLLRDEQIAAQAHAKHMEEVNRLTELMQSLQSKIHEARNQLEQVPAMLFKDVPHTIRLFPSAKGLPVMDLFSTDPYFKLFHKDSKSPIYQSDVITKQLNPSWEQFELKVDQFPQGVNTVLNFQLFDFDKVSAHDFIGSAAVNLAELIETKTQSIPLENPESKRKTHGNLIIRLEVLTTVPQPDVSNPKHTELSKQLADLENEANATGSRLAQLTQMTETGSFIPAELTAALSHNRARMATLQQDYQRLSTTCGTITVQLQQLSRRVVELLEAQIVILTRDD